MTSRTKDGQAATPLRERVVVTSVCDLVLRVDGVLVLGELVAVGRERQNGGVA